MSHWNYRVLRREIDEIDGSYHPEYAVHEVYWSGDKVTGWTERPAIAVADSVEELRDVLKKMLTAPEFEVIDVD